ncbi:hypothetical protein Tco_1253228 [Tanacetum coccineum]
MEPDVLVISNVNEDECFDPGGGEINVEVDDSFIFVTRTFLPYLAYPEDSLSGESKDFVQIKQKNNGQNSGPNTNTGTDRVHKSWEFLAKIASSNALYDWLPRASGEWTSCAKDNTPISGKNYTKQGQKSIQSSKDVGLPAWHSV